jgi:pyruvate formate lyase activating enzyme
MSPLVVDIKRNSLDDGPGIRSVVFFKGCPLRCRWCQNPETLSRGPQIQREAKRCASCGACFEACPEAIARPASEPETREGCGLCGACVEACPTSSRRIVGTQYELVELVEVLSRDEPFYRRSGGGVTLSGGEPALYPEHVGLLAASLASRGIHVLLETSGHFDWSLFEEHLLPHLGAIYFDLKIADPEAHKVHTGVDNRRIHENLGRLARAGFDELLVRFPLVPGITDSDDNLRAVAELAREHGLRELRLLPYNPLWIAKRLSLGMELSYEDDRWMSEDEITRCRDLVDDVLRARS